MTSFFYSRQRPALAWVWGLLLLGLGWLQPQAAQATHLRAGEIQAKVDSITGNPNHIYFKMTIYRDNRPNRSPLNPPTVFFGDNTRLENIGEVVNGVRIGTRTTVVNTALETDIVTFTFDHVYPGPATYPVSYTENNRNADIINMFRSIDQSFYIASSITVNPAYGLNHSPVLRAPAIDRAAVGQVWLHNPAAYDADGDSLAYRLRTCQQVVNGVIGAINNNNTPQPTVCTGYVYPNDPSITPVATQIAFVGTPAQGIPTGVPGAAAIIVQDAYNGQITWNAPSRAGEYNIAFVVEEWRRTPFGRIQIGSVIRDMQIIVSATSNTPPSLTVPADLCVVAGTALTLSVSAVDGSSAGNPATNVSLFAYSGILPPASFTQNSVGTSVTGTFRWTPECGNVANQPYVVLFKAQDTPANGSIPILVDEKPVRITVIGPAPQNLQVAIAPGPRLTTIVSWNRYTCQNANQISIYRKEGAGPGPGPCETGIPPAWGYVRIGAVPVTATSFADDNNGNGLSRGKTYCYRIYAGFPLPAGGASLASAEACATLGGRAARLKNVDVDVTGVTTGQITVRWTPPRPTNVNVPYLAPGYVLRRGEGLAPTSFTQVATFVGLGDSSYVDTGLDTQNKQYTYQLTFTYQDASSGTAQTVSETVPVASSVRLRVRQPGAGNSLALSWTYNVPWDNSQQPTRVFRQNSAGVYTQVGTASSGATGGSFTDTDPSLTKGQTYCYYVETNGQYADATPAAGLAYLRNLLNKSQQSCAPLLDIPCTPVLSIQPLNCDSLSARGTVVGAQQRYVNKLRWTTGTDPAGCSTTAAYYRILRAATSAGPFVALDSTAGLSYADRNLSQPAYCYQVQAVTAAGARSEASNAACQQECFFFELPNVFTPNGDGVNDTFRPRSASGVARTHIAIYNRWGRKVYESDRYPYIDWAGGGQAGESTTSGMVTDGLYYFLAEVTFTDAAQTTRTFKGWVQLVR